jgi:hypothetical protein
MPYSVEIWLIVSEKVNDVMEQSEQDLPLWAKLKEQRLNREQSALAEKKTALAEKEAIRAEKKTALAEKEKKHLAKLEELHSDLCDTTHPRTTHAKWANMVNQRGVKLKSIYTTVFCLNCKEKIPVRDKSWVMRVMSKKSKKTASRGSRGTRKKIKLHFCERCGISPEDVRQVRTTKKIVDPPSPSYFQSPSRVRLYSGQRKH